jgi:hypothetical protein
MSENTSNWNASIDSILAEWATIEAAIDLAATTSDPATGLGLLVQYKDTPEVLDALAGNPGLSRGCRDRAAEVLAGLNAGSTR